MSTGSAVDAWFSELQHPPIMLRVREIIRRADGRISELVKYRTVRFECVTGMAGFVHVNDPKRVSLMFNAAGKVKGEYPHLEGKSVKSPAFCRYVGRRYSASGAAGDHASVVRPARPLTQSSALRVCKARYC
jgi:hypothetical protein